MYPRLETYIAQITNAFNSIPAGRKETLHGVSRFIKNALKEQGTAHLTFICTHNSRRSHLAQIWTQTAAAHYQIEGLQTYSGGTEATAFNHRAVAAIKRAGFKVNKTSSDLKNPEYQVFFSPDEPPIICFSKTFDACINPAENFTAIMTCSHADANCPFVPGATYRQRVTYRDPKESDGSDYEKKTYDERCRQIATEMFYMVHQMRAVKLLQE